ncbi:MAG TPA: energy transducer TonB [Ignavibacteriales bacterium]|nr:energy transducer TonB [Ignavibacteriales bacterium]
MSIYLNPLRYRTNSYHSNLLKSFLISFIVIYLFIRYVPFYEISTNILNTLNIDFNFQTDKIIENLNIETESVATNNQSAPTRIILTDKKDNAKLNSSEIDLNTNEKADENKSDNNNVITKNETIDIFYAAADFMPEPVDGWENLYSKAKLTPSAIENEVFGRVMVKAYIDENGFVVKTEILKGLGYGCDEIAQRIVKNTRFTPAKLKGKKVKVQMSIPIKFNK